jgi:uncharacterized protein YvpB
VGTPPFSQSANGWIEASQVVPSPAPDVDEPGMQRISLPYFSQLDGQPWEEANCGPTALAMGLGALGIKVSSTEMRRHVTNAQQIWGNHAGTFIWALAYAAEGQGAKPLDLYRGTAFKRWTVAEVRQHVLNDRPVILQVRYRALPGRSEKRYFGDHYIVVTGVSGERFIYNDPIDSDGPGANRLMSGLELERAMNAADKRFAYAGFALSR